MMDEAFKSALLALLRPENGHDFYLFDPDAQFQGQPADQVAIAKSLNAAFLIALAVRIPVKSSTESGPCRPVAERSDAG